MKILKINILYIFGYISCPKFKCQNFGRGLILTKKKKRFSMKKYIKNKGQHFLIRRYFREMQVGKCIMC